MATVAPRETGSRIMPVSDLSFKTVPPVPPPCPTCGKEMKLLGEVPNVEGTIYEYICENDEDRLTWQPRHREVRSALNVGGRLS